mgnify:CR=1 FL=1
MNGGTHARERQPPPRPQQKQPPRKAPKHVLLVIVDDLRPDLGVYGRSWARTPNLDRLGAQGTVFSSAHAAVANCCPSRAALLTGRRPDWNGVIDLYTHVRTHEPNTTTLPQHLKDSGWNTAFHGKVFHHGQDDGSRSWTYPHGPDWGYAKYMTPRGGLPVSHRF